MKSSKYFRPGDNVIEADDLKKNVKLPPAKKNGKERYSLYQELGEDDDAEIEYVRKESVFDYMDEEEEND